MALGLIFCLLAVAGTCRSLYVGRPEGRLVGGILLTAIALSLAWHIYSIATSPPDYAT